MHSVSSLPCARSRPTNVRSAVVSIRHIQEPVRGQRLRLFRPVWRQNRPLYTQTVGRSLHLPFKSCHPPRTSGLSRVQQLYIRIPPFPKSPWVRRKAHAQQCDMFSWWTTRITNGSSKMERERRHWPTIPPKWHRVRLHASQSFTLRWHLGTTRTIMPRTFTSCARSATAFR